MRRHKCSFKWWVCRSPTWRRQLTKQTERSRMRPRAVAYTIILCADDPKGTRADEKRVATSGTSESVLC